MEQPANKGVAPRPDKAPRLRREVQPWYPLRNMGCADYPMFIPNRRKTQPVINLFLSRGAFAFAVFCMAVCCVPIGAQQPQTATDQQQETKTATQSDSSSDGKAFFEALGKQKTQERASAIITAITNGESVVRIEREIVEQLQATETAEEKRTIIRAIRNFLNGSTAPPLPETSRQDIIRLLHQSEPESAPVPQNPPVPSSSPRASPQTAPTESTPPQSRASDRLGIWDWLQAQWAGLGPNRWWFLLGFLFVAGFQFYLDELYDFSFGQLIFFLINLAAWGYWGYFVTGEAFGNRPLGVMDGMIIAGSSFLWTLQHKQSAWRQLWNAVLWGIGVGFCSGAGVWAVSHLGGSATWQMVGGLLAASALVLYVFGAFTHKVGPAQPSAAKAQARSTSVFEMLRNIGTVLFVVLMGWQVLRFFDKSAPDKISEVIQGSFKTAQRHEGWVTLGHNGNNCTFEYLEPVLNDGTGHEYWSKQTCPTEQTERHGGQTYKFFVKKVQVELECDGEMVSPRRVQYFDQNEANESGQWEISGLKIPSAAVVNPNSLERPIVEKYCTSGGRSTWTKLDKDDSCTYEYLEPTVKVTLGVWFWRRERCSEPQTEDIAEAPGGTVKYASALKHYYLACESEKVLVGYFGYFDDHRRATFQKTVHEPMFGLPPTSKDFDADAGRLIGPDDSLRPVLNKYCR